MSQDLKAKQILDLINQGHLTKEQALEILDMSETKTKMLGRDGQHLYSANDITGRCPTCYTSAVIKIGKLSIDGTEQDVNKCEQCNKLFSGADGGVKSILEEAAIVYETKNVGFISLENTQAQIPTQNFNSSISDYNTHTHLQTVNSSIENVSSQLYALSNTIRNLVEQNNQLMEKLATDPLAGMKKAINTFNLE